MKTYKEKITEVYGQPVAVSSGKLSTSHNSNCYYMASKIGVPCFAVAGARAGKYHTEGYDLYFYKGFPASDTAAFHGRVIFEQ